MDSRTTYIAWLWKASAGSRARISAACAAGIGRIGAALGVIWNSKILVDIATGHSDADIRLHIILMAGCMILQTSLSVIVTRLNAVTEVRMKNRLRKQLFDHILESRWQGRVAMHTGDMMSRIESDVRAITSVVCKSVPAMMTTLVQFAAAAYLMASMDWRILLCIVFLMPAAVVAGKGYFRKIRSLNRKILDTGSRVQSHIQENIQHRTLISAMEMGPGISGELSSMQDSLEKQVRERTDYSLFSKTAVQLGFTVGYITVFIWCIFGLLDGRVSDKYRSIGRKTF